MTREEAVAWLSAAKWALADMGFTIEAADTEWAELLVYQRHVPVGDLREYADSLVAPGRRGRIALALRHPAEARARALSAAILRAVRE